jgi:hypothetical protein
VNRRGTALRHHAHARLEPGQPHRRVAHRAPRYVHNLPSCNDACRPARTSSSGCTTPRKATTTRPKAPGGRSWPTTRSPRSWAGSASGRARPPATEASSTRPPGSTRWSASSAMRPSARGGGRPSRRRRRMRYSIPKHRCRATSWTPRSPACWTWASRAHRHARLHPSRRLGQDHGRGVAAAPDRRRLAADARPPGRRVRRREHRRGRGAQRATGEFEELTANCLVLALGQDADLAAGTSTPGCAVRAVSQRRRPPDRHVRRGHRRPRRVHRAVRGPPVHVLRHLRRGVPLRRDHHGS